MHNPITKAFERWKLLDDAAQYYESQPSLKYSAINARRKTDEALREAYLALWTLKTALRFVEYTDE